MFCVIKHYNILRKEEEEKFKKKMRKAKRMHEEKVESLVSGEDHVVSRESKEKHKNLTGASRSKQPILSICRMDMTKPCWKIRHQINKNKHYSRVVWRRALDVLRSTNFDL